MSLSENRDPLFRDIRGAKVIATTTPLLCAYFLGALPTIRAVRRIIAKEFGKRIRALSKGSPALLPPRNVAENGR
jgi:hypothetical protein